MNPIRGGTVERMSGGAANPAPSAQEAKLRKTAVQLEGLFVQRMFAAMRETVPQDGLMGQSSAEQTFGTMLDEKLAEQVPQQMSGSHSLAEALYKQLRNRIEGPAAEASAAVPPSSASPLHRATASPEN
jgi:flagellar protein FlgJ